MYKNKPVFPSSLLFAAVLMLFLPACSFSPVESDSLQTDELIVDRDGNHMDQTPEDHSEITGYGGTLQFPDGTDLSFPADEPAELPPMYTDFAARFSEDDILVNTDPQGKILLSEDFAGSRYVCFSMEALETATSMPYPDIEDHIVYVDVSEHYIENLQPDTIYIPISNLGNSVTCQNSSGNSDPFEIHQAGQIRFYFANHSDEDIVITIHKQRLFGIWSGKVTVNGESEFEIPAHDSVEFDANGSNMAKGTYRCEASNKNGSDFDYLCAPMTCDTGISNEQLLPAPRMSDDGTFTGSKFTHTEVLNDRNDSTFNFYVKNNGKTDVEISINGKHKTTIAAGKEGHISETLGFLNKSYECVAKAAVDGAEIDIYWAVAVRD